MLFRVEAHNFKIENVAFAKARTKLQKLNRARKIQNSLLKNKAALNSLENFFDIDELTKVFLQDYFEQDTYKFVNSPAASKNLQSFKFDALPVTPDSIFKMLPKLKHHQIHLFCDGKLKNLKENPNLNDVIGVKDAACIKTLLSSQGTGLRIHRAHESFVEIDQLLSGLQKFFKAPLTATIYFNQSKGSILSPHWDDHDVFVFQIYGTKRWQLQKNRFDLPCRYFRFFDSQISLEWPKAETLQPGNVLYVPRGTWHQTVSTQSIHLTIGLGEETYASLAHDAVINAMIDAFNDADFRCSVIGRTKKGKSQVERKLKKKLLSKIAISLEHV